MEHDSRTRASGDRQADTLEWKTYDFKYKLNANESGASLVFHLPRLDRRLWVLPVEARRGQSPPSWFYAFLDRRFGARFVHSLWPSTGSSGGGRAGRRATC